MPTRTGQATGTAARAAVTVHTAPLILPVSGPPIEDGALAVRDGRILRIGPRAALAALYPGLRPVRWPGMIVPGLVDAHVRLGRAPSPALSCGVTAVAGVVAPDGDRDAARDACGPLDPETVAGAVRAGLAGVTYLETRCPDERRWESGERDRLITALREVDHPGIVGIAAHSPDPEVMEDLAVLSRTFGLRLLAELGDHGAALLDEAGALGPGSHVAVSGPLDEADRKLLRLRGTVAALTSPFAAEGMLDGENPIAIGTRTGGDPLALARSLARDPGTDRLLVEALTLGGARALGLDTGPGRLGCLAPGARADFAVFAVGAGPETACTALLREGPGRCVAAFTGGRAAWRRTGTGRAALRPDGFRTAPDPAHRSISG
ncbi:hypothetical protein ACFOWE_23375 [Planomonospora corallina]|uniref:Aminodeoxyfutalosine deaminase/Imidazolonepropionase-like composite domain-containing protein n=1 Tax=Planomonospora corallina TaxID=1806052 RepID=A0ABV8IB58_9ACTN